MGGRSQVALGEAGCAGLAMAAAGRPDPVFLELCGAGLSGRPRGAMLVVGAACAPQPGPAVCILYLRWLGQHNINKVKIGTKVQTYGKPGQRHTHRHGRGGEPSWLEVRSMGFRVAGASGASLPGRGALCSWWLCLVFGL